MNDFLRKLENVEINSKKEEIILNNIKNLAGNLNIPSELTSEYILGEIKSNLIELNNKDLMEAFRILEIKIREEIGFRKYIKSNLELFLVRWQYFKELLIFENIDLADALSTKIKDIEANIFKCIELNAKRDNIEDRLKQTKLWLKDLLNITKNFDQDLNKHLEESYKIIENLNTTNTIK